MRIVALLCLIPAFGFAPQDDPPIGKKRGEMFPDFLLPTVDGKFARISDFRGKKVLLFHFASW